MLRSHAPSPLRRFSRASVALAVLALCAGACSSAGGDGDDDDDGPECGNGRIEADELCDGSDFGAATCATEGFDAGELGCTAECTIDTAACVILDADLDGVPIDQEIAAGTDPNNPDSDGDGFTDGEELGNATNPLDMYSWPPNLGRWPNRLGAAIADGVMATGFKIGEVAPNTVLPDQFGNELQMHQLYGYGVVLSIGAVWCPPCNEAAKDSPALMAKHVQDGVVFVEYLVDGPQQGVDATLLDAEKWATKYGLQFPVIWGKSSWSYSTKSLPTYVFIDKTMHIVDRVEGYPGDAGIEAKLAKVK